MKPVAFELIVTAKDAGRVIVDKFVGDTPRGPEYVRVFADGFKRDPLVERLPFDFLPPCFGIV